MTIWIAFHSDPMKTCFKCGKGKDRSQFYAHPAMSDGLLGKCKECTKADAHKRYEANRTEINAYDRHRSSLPHRVQARQEYAQTPRGKAARARATAKYAQDRQKAIARNAVSNGLRDGKIQRLPCLICGDKKSQAHHSDYSKPLDVTWLCEAHHKLAHKTKSLVQRLMF